MSELDIIPKWVVFGDIFGVSGKKADFERVFLLSPSDFSLILVFSYGVRRGRFA